MELYYKRGETLHQVRADRQGDAIEVTICERKLKANGRLVAGIWLMEVDGRLLPIRVVRCKDERYILADHSVFHLTATDPSHLREERTMDDPAHSGEIVAPMPGKIIRILVKEGQEVEKDQDLLVMEAMKMEYTLRAPKPGRVESIAHGPGQQLEMGTMLMRVVGLE